MLFVTLLEIPGKVNFDINIERENVFQFADHLTSRLFEQHLETLLIWANTAIDKTTNQPMLPHAFLIINAFAVEVWQKKNYPTTLYYLRDCTVPRADF